MSARATAGSLRRMLYKILGMLVWNGAKTLLRAKYGRTYMPARVR